MGRAWKTVLAQAATWSLMLAAIAVRADAQEHAWSKDFGNVEAFAWTTAVAANPTNEVFAAGCFDRNVNFGGSTFSANGTDSFVGKYRASDGRHRWSIHITGGRTVCIASIAVDAAGNLFVTGNFDQNISSPIGPFTTAGAPDIFLAKFSGVDGRHLWSARMGGRGTDKPLAVAVDSNGDVLVTGFFTQTADFGGAEHTSAGASDVFLAKYAGNNGRLVWSQRMGGSGSDTGNAVSAMPTGGIALAGKFNGQVDFGGGTLGSAGQGDAFVAAYSSNGGHAWSRAIGAEGDDGATGVGVDRRGDVVVTGFFYYTVDFGGAPIIGSNRASIFLAKYRGTDSAHLWSDGYGAPISNGEIPNALAIDEFDNIVLTGAISGHVDFGGGPLDDNFTTDIFVAQFDGDGQHLWSDRYGGSFADRGLSAATDASGNAIIGGSFSESVNFGGGTLLSPGGTDAFVVKFRNEAAPVASPTNTSPPTHTPRPPATPTPIPTNTFLPTATHTPTQPPPPTNTRVPSHTSVPTHTSSPLPTSTPPLPPTATSTPTVNAEGAELVGQTEYPPASTYRLPIHATLYALTPPGSTPEEVATCEARTNEGATQGEFRCSGLPSGSFTICIKNSKTLQNCRLATLVSGPNQVDFGALVSGEAEQAGTSYNTVNLVDFSVLQTTFGLRSGNEGYDQRADFTYDGDVNLLDFSVLSTNFAQVGDEPGETSQTAGALLARNNSASPRPADLTVNAPAVVTLGDEPELFQITVAVEVGTQSVDGAAAYLSFDPEVLQVVDVQLGTELNEPLGPDGPTWDNTDGVISIAAGKLEGPFPDSTFELATVTLKALRPAASTSLTLIRDVNWWSDVTFNGGSILGALRPADLSVVEETSTPVCAGDCNEDTQVTVDEVLHLVNTALDGSSLTDCPAGDVNGDGQITVDEITAATLSALDGCPAPGGS
jgi:hypothetical protein